MTDILGSLKEQLALEEAKAAAATAAADDLRTAINALVAKRAGTVVQQDEPVRRKRGELMRVVLDAVREGKGTHRQIRQAVADARIHQGAKNSISMALHRLQKQIVWNPDESRYLIRSDENNRAALIGALKVSAEIAEGSKVVALKPSGLNGAAGVHPPTTALHTAST